MAGLDPTICPAIVQLAEAAKTGAMQGGWVYIVTNRRNGTLYVGFTSNPA
jgi:hypothetical protein